MHKIIRVLPIILSCVLLSFFVDTYGKENKNETVLTGNNPEDSPSYEDNKFCLRCHASEDFELTNPSTGEVKRQTMCENFRLSEKKYYNGVHWAFGCMDCHSSDYQTFPHAAELRFEPAFECVDCHGGDENFAQYHFEEIDTEYNKSVHAKIDNGEFTCWKCHDPHSYAPLARRDSLTFNFVVASNDMCLSCHGNFERLHLLSDRELTNIVPRHDWLPNQALHFRSVRCIECHSAQNEEILISHNILPRDSAISDCVKCHSGNSILMGTLYKFRTIQNRKSYGFVNAAIIQNDSYVIGANHSRFMNISGIVIIILTLLAIIIHTAFRIRKAKS